MKDMNQSSPAVKAPELEAQTFFAHFHSHHSPDVEYKGVLDSFNPTRFSVVVDKSPAVGHLVTFSMFNGKEKFLHGTAKIHAVTAITADQIQVEMDMVQADPHAIKHAESVFIQRQSNIHNWVKTLREY